MFFLSKQDTTLLLMSSYRYRTIGVTVTHLKPNETEMAGGPRGFASNAKWTEINKRNRIIMHAMSHCC